MSEASIMPAAYPNVRTEWDIALGALAAANAASCDLAEAMRGDMPIASNLRHRETVENLADALRAVLALHLLVPPSPELTDQIGRHADACRLMAAVQEFLEGWDE